MQYLLEVNSVDIIAVDFSYDILKVTENKISYIFRDHAQTINKPTYIWITDRSSLYQEKLDEKIFHQGNC